MTRVPLEGKVLNENERAAAELRAEFARHGVFAVNLISSPGSGKTALLERTLESDLLDAATKPERADLLLLGELNYAGPLVSEVTGIPWASYVLAPLSFFSRL